MLSTTAPAARRWTATESGTCAVCGLESTRHSVVSSACPHTADSLTDAQVIDAWRFACRLRRMGWGSPISIGDCLDASPGARALLSSIAFPYPPPLPLEAQRAREKIAGILNTMEPT